VRLHHRLTILTVRGRARPRGRLCGRKAHEGWDRARLTLDLPVLRVPHPSGRWLNAHREDRTKIVDALRDARRLAGLR
jgi:hypothetical protein